MAQGYIDDIIDVKAIDSQIASVEKRLATLEGVIDEASKRMRRLFDEVGKSSSFRELEAQQKQYTAQVKVMTEALERRARLTEQQTKLEEQYAAAVSKSIQNQVQQTQAQQAAVVTGGTLDATYKTIYKDFATFDGALKKSVGTLNENASGIAQLRKRLEELKKGYKEGKVSETDYVKESEQLKLQISQTTILFKEQLKDMQAQSGSMTELAARLGLMRKAYRELSEEERNSEVGKELQQNIHAADAEIKKLDSDIGNYQRNVGNYASAFQGMGSEIRHVGAELGGFGTAFENVGTGISGVSRVLSVYAAGQRTAARLTKLGAGATEGATVAQKGLNAAMKAAPFMWLVVAVELLVRGIIALVSWYKNLDTATVMENRATEAAIETTAAAAVAYENNVKILQSATATQRQYDTALKAAAAEASKYGATFENNNDLMKWYIDNGADIIEQRKQEAEMSELARIQEELRVKLQKEEIEASEQQKLVAELEVGALRDRAAAYTYTLAKFILWNKERKRDNIAKDKAIAEEQYNKALEKSSASMSKNAGAAKNAGADIEEANKRQLRLELLVLQGQNNTFDNRRSIARKQAELEKSMVQSSAMSAEEKKLIEQKLANELAAIQREERDAMLKDEAALITMRLNQYAKGSEERLQQELKAWEKEKKAAISAAKKAGQDVNVVVQDFENKRKTIILNGTQDRLSAQQDALDNELFGLREFDEKYRKLIIQRIELERAAALATAEANGASIEDVNKRFDNLIAGVNQDFADAVATNDEKLLEKRSKILERTSQLFQNTSLSQIKNEHKRAQAILDAEYETNKAIVEDSIKTYKEILKSADITAEKREEIAEKLAGAEMELAALKTAYEIAKYQETVKALEDFAAQAKEVLNAVAEIGNMIFDALSAGYERQIEDLERLQEKSDEYFDQQQRNLDDTIMTDERRAEEQQRIDEQRAASEKKTQDEIAAMKLKQAKLDKAMAITNATIAFAQALILAVTAGMAAAAQSGLAAPVVGPVYTAILSGIAAGIAGAQLAIIAAQPLPKYAKGGTDVSGWGMFGEAGTELAVNKTQGLLLASQPTIAKFDPHTTIFNAADTARMFAEMNSGEGNKTEIDYDRINDIMKRNKSVQTVTLDSRGLYTRIMKQGHSHFINSKITI
jgi:hypothetical protein